MVDFVDNVNYGSSHFFKLSFTNVFFETDMLPDFMKKFKSNRCNWFEIMKDAMKAVQSFRNNLVE
jgi:hypothetical protein